MPLTADGQTTYHIALLWHGEVSLIRLRPVCKRWLTTPSVLWHCWLGHQTCKTSSPKWPINCVEWDVKPCWTQLDLPSRSNKIVKICHIGAYNHSRSQIFSSTSPLSIRHSFVANSRRPCRLSRPHTFLARCSWINRATLAEASCGFVSDSWASFSRSRVNVILLL